MLKQIVFTLTKFVEKDTTYFRYYISTNILIKKAL